MTADPFTDAARAEAEALVDDIIRWDDTIATDGPCDGTWDSLAAYLAGRGWARTHLAAQEPQVTIRSEEGKPATCEVRQGGVLIFSGRDHSADARAARRDEEKR